jgi:hypothetical protein
MSKSLQLSSSSMSRSRAFCDIMSNMMNGPATEALERSMKRRRVSNADEEENASVASNSSCVSCSSKSDDESPLFNLNDAFDAISSVEDESYVDFPVISWDFDP